MNWGPDAMLVVVGAPANWTDAHPALVASVPLKDGGSFTSEAATQVRLRSSIPSHHPAREG